MLLFHQQAELEGRAAQPSSPGLTGQKPLISEREHPFDLLLVGAVLALLVIGTIEIFSSSAVEALRKQGDSLHFLRKHVFFLATGTVAIAVGSHLHYRWLKRYTYLLLLVSMLSLAAVLVAGVDINGARRWFSFGPLSFQPVELAKLSLIAFLAYSLSKKADKVRFFTIGFVPHLFVCLVMMALLMKQPDFGSSILLGATTLTMLFVAGAKVSYLLLAVLVSAPVGYLTVVGTWRLQRFLAYLNPEGFRDGAAYQIIQSRIAIGSGGATGVGMGEGRQALGYMPEGYNDFIMSSIGEELGFVGFLLVLTLFAVILWRGLRAAQNSRDAFGAYLAFGITLNLAFQALINTSVVLGLLPAKGITLPFVSYGGSSLVMSMFLVGILLNVGRRPRVPVRSRELVNGHCARRRRRRAVIVCDS
jgi:cell division protein FtsW